MFAPNRIAIYLTAIAGLATAIVPAVEGIDTTTAATTIAGLAGIVTVAYKWLEGWQRHEARQAAIAHPHLVGAGTSTDTIVNHNYPQQVPVREAPSADGASSWRSSEEPHDEGDLESPGAADLLDGVELDDPNSIPTDLGDIGSMGATI